jgi:hypothetical protein
MQNIFKIYFILVFKLNRPDSDDYINVILGNIHPEWQNQFRKPSGGEYWDLASPYDFESIMV